MKHTVFKFLYYLEEVLTKVWNCDTHPSNPVCLVVLLQNLQSSLHWYLPFIVLGDSLSLCIHSGKRKESCLMHQHWAVVLVGLQTTVLWSLLIFPLSSWTRNTDSNPQTNCNTTETTSTLRPSLVPIVRCLSKTNFSSFLSHQSSLHEGAISFLITAPLELLYFFSWEDIKLFTLDMAWGTSQYNKTPVKSSLVNQWVYWSYRSKRNSEVAKKKKKPTQYQWWL